MTSENVEELFEKALELLKAKKNREAFEILKKLVDNTPSSIYEVEARYLSYYGYLTGIVGNNYKRGIELCNEAIKREFFHPDFYLNLGRLYLAISNKGLAVKTFYKGLRIDKTNKELIEEIKKLGVRKKPVFSFFLRDNPVNRFAGRIRVSLRRLLKGAK
jgi:tetratricopeptide (TPR) repeat protein